MANISKIIDDLKQSFGGSNDEQMKAVQLLKGLATSDDPEANKFMKALDTATTKIANDMKEGEFMKTIIEIQEDIQLPGTDIVLEKGDRIEIMDEAETFKCPECGSKVLKQTNYCVKCKKKVGDKK